MPQGGVAEGVTGRVILMIGSTMSLVLYREAKVCLDRGELDESFRLFTSFINDQNSVLHPEELTDSYNSRGHIRYLWVDFDDAIKDYTRAIKRNSSFPVAHYNRGQVHYRLGERLLCIKSFVILLMIVTVPQR